MRAVVLAGGLGTRLRGRHPDLPKPMVPIGGRPFLEYLLDRLLAGGVRSIVLSVGYKASVIQAHFGATYRGMCIEYAIEKEPLGTGGAIVHALQANLTQPAMVLNGDSLVDMDFSAFIQWYLRDPTRIAVALAKSPSRDRFGAVVLEGNIIVEFSSRGDNGPGLISAGVYVVHPGVFAELNLSGAFSFENDLLQRHCGTLRPKAYVCDGFFIDIGVPEDLNRAQLELPDL